MEPYQKASAARKQFLKLFKEPDYTESFATFTDLVWQILVNGSTEGKTLAFTPNVDPKGNELVMADSKGGFLRTWIYFVSDNYNECADHCTALNEFIFNHSKEEAQKIINKSMFG